MESTIKDQLHHLADKVEHALFGGANELTQDQINYFQSFFASDSYVFTTNLIKYFKQELCVGFLFNMILLGVFAFYIPGNFRNCWSCNSMMALWLLALALLNVVLVLPKALLIRKLFRIEETVDIYMANYSIWNFFRSKVYKFNITMSRYIFCTYIVGIAIFLLSWSSTEFCEGFYKLIAFLLGSFVVRVVGSFYKYLHNFSNPQQAENLMELFQGTASEDIQSLKVSCHEEYFNEYNRDDKDCPICYEQYEKSDEVRVMECPGNHAFHKKCIDKWLLKSTRCPQCNLSVFWKTEQAKAKKND